MESPDVVDTSDVEEREVFAVPEDANYQRLPPSMPIERIRPHILALAQSASTEKDRQCLPTARRNRSSGDEAGCLSPRKRTKMAHDANLVLLAPAHSGEPSFLNDRSPSLQSVVQIPGSCKYANSKENMLTDDDDEQASSVLSPRLNWHSLFSSPRWPHVGSNGSHQIQSQDVESPSISLPLPHLRSRSPSLSTDHHSLFSSPRHRSTTPPQTSSPHSHNQSNSMKSKSHAMASSPLTPASSPALLAQSLSQSPDPLQLISQVLPLPASRPDPPPPIPLRVLSPPVEIPEDPHPLGRYSLRRREARQLNPYAYDKLLYKQQLKHLPAAIVKFRSPRHRTEPDKVGDEDTQNDIIFPLDEDSDYVDMRIASGSRQRSGKRMPSFDRNNRLREDGREVEVGHADGSWVPKVLKEGLSSSDEDEDDEIRKLARKALKDQEKADATARAKARRAAAGTRRAEIEAKMTAKKWRIKPFPIHRDAKQASARRPLPLKASLSPCQSQRAHSMPAMAPYFISPVEFPSGPPAHFRASSHSPTLNYMRQDGPHQIDEHETWFPPNVLPNDHSTTHSAPPSPSGPPTTSGASGLPSNTSGMDTESDQSHIFEMSSKDRKRLRALRRMMPAAMITRQLGVAKTAQAPPQRARVQPKSSGSEAEEVRLIPGLAKVRRGSCKDAEVRGDPASSEVERASDTDDNTGNEDVGLGEVEMLSDGQSAVSVKRPRCVSSSFKHKYEVISISDSSTPGSSEDSESESSDDEMALQSLFDRPARGPARERSLIDWMLTRTRNLGKPKSKSKITTSSQKSHTPGKPRSNIVTGGARRYRERNQTLLPFVRAHASPGTTLTTKRSSKHRGHIAQLHQGAVDESKKRKKKWKRQSATGQALVHNVHHNATRITSKHHEGKSSRERNNPMVGDRDDESRQNLDPGWKVEVERWNRPVSLAYQPIVEPRPSAPAAAPPRLYRRTFPRPENELPLPLYFQREESFVSHHRHIAIDMIDMHITPLPSGVKFGTASYIGKGLLHQLISVTSGNSEVVPPTVCNVQGLEIGPTTSAAVFSALLGPLCDRLASALRNFSVDDAGAVKEWESVACASTQLLSWLAVHGEDQEFNALEVTLREYLDGLLLFLESLDTNIFCLTAYWFVVECFARLAAGIKYRRGSFEKVHLVQSAKRLIQRLLGIDLQTAFVTFHAAGDVDVTLLPHRAAELWICLVHLLPNFDVPAETAAGHPLWRLLARLHPDSTLSELNASECLWRVVFSLCALSQFSVHGLSTSVFRLPAAWDVVAAALKKIVLSVNPEQDHQLTQRSLKKRDEYLKCIVSRCFLLWNQWGWRLDDAIIMFKSLQEIFRSRNFGNLLTERSAPMGFLHDGDLELLSKKDSDDSVFELFLKMVVQAVNQLNANDALDPKQRSAHIKKLLQMAVPVSPVPFSRSAPPTAHSVSMLVNRFCAMVVAVHLDPTLSNIKFRVGHAKRCVNFRDADDDSRVACVYGMMNFAMIARHHRIAGGLEEVLSWLGEMADVLMDEYQKGQAGSVRKQHTTTLIQLLIGSVRRVTETQSLDKEHSQAEYPDPALLDGPWITRVFNPRIDLITIEQTAVEIRMLVQSFLDARLKALPTVRPLSPPVVYNIESQESQDEYDKLFLDLNDEELLAALGEGTKVSAIADLKLKEEALCKVLDKSITPAVYRLVCRYFGNNEHATNNATSAAAADQWIDCWVGCANVLVQNDQKDWGLYMKLGQQSWEKIIDDAGRRRVGLRFNLTLLRLDPRAYSKMRDDFVAVLLVAILSCKTTIEHEFMSVMLSLDGLQHPLLRTAPLDPIPGTRKYEVSQANYEIVRGRLIKAILLNIAGCLRAKVDAESQSYVELVVMMLSTMRDIYQELSDDKQRYSEFCQRTFHELLSHPELVAHPRMSVALAWGRREWNL